MFVRSKLIAITEDDAVFCWGLQSFFYKDYFEGLNFE